MKIHIVQKGDTLWKIAQKYNVSFEELKNMNTQLSDPNMLMPGMKIKVPSGDMYVKKHKKEAPFVKEAPYVKEKPIKHVPMPAPIPKKIYEESPESPEGFHPMPEVNIPIAQPPAPLPMMPPPQPLPCGCPPMMPPPPPLPCGCQPIMPPCPQPMPGMVHGMPYPGPVNMMPPVMGEMEMHDESSSFMTSSDNNYYMGAHGMMPHAPYYGGYGTGGYGNPHMYGNPQPYPYEAQPMPGYSPMMPGYSQAPIFPGYGYNPYGMESSYIGHYRESENEEKSNDDDEI